jgi:hypothetical protein
MTPAEQDVAAAKHFGERYEEIAHHRFVANRPIRLYDHDPRNSESRRCRFCRRGEPDVTFREVAHAVPEFLGNKAIRSMNECDACNTFLANNYEDHLSKWSLFARSVSQIKGRKGIPTFNNSAKTLRIETRDTGFGIRITDPTTKEEPLKEGGRFRLAIPSDTSSAPHIPIRAAKALVKIACSICPLAEIGQCREAIDWLMERSEIHMSPFLVFYGFTPGPISERAGRVILLRRKAESLEPYLWLVVQSAGHRFQIFVPGCPADAELFVAGEAIFPAWHYPIPEFGPVWPYGETEYGRLDWSGTEPVRASATAVFCIEQIKQVSEGRPDDSTGRKR